MAVRRNHRQEEAVIFQSMFLVRIFCAGVQALFLQGRPGKKRKREKVSPKRRKRREKEKKKKHVQFAQTRVCHKGSGVQVSRNPVPQAVARGTSVRAPYTLR